MPYKTVKVNDRIVFVPDGELKKRLRSKMGKARRLRWFSAGSAISCFGRKTTLKRFLARHQGGRFFVIVDFVYAFHQITRQTVARFLNQIADPFWDECFAELDGRQVLPIGFPTSSFLFEAVMNRAIDNQLVAWAEANSGTVTRYADNVLVTWKKNPFGPFRDLLGIFRGFDVRWTPKEPRRWDDQTPIRFCGLTLHRDGRIGLSQRKRKQFSRKAGAQYLSREGSSARGIEEFVRANSY